MTEKTFLHRATGQYHGINALGAIIREEVDMSHMTRDTIDIVMQAFHGKCRKEDFVITLAKLGVEEFGAIIKPAVSSARTETKKRWSSTNQDKNNRMIADSFGHEIFRRAHDIMKVERDAWDGISEYPFDENTDLIVVSFAIDPYMDAEFDNYADVKLLWERYGLVSLIEMIQSGATIEAIKSAAKFDVDSSLITSL